ncbi:uncharacterized protein LOC107269328 [Cephus cinctus]|uniref:Uncharacterized protein LOC107269328 n=1 Tax=Cephus cinctus TaxID=211228 RepID=A0AAJ7BZV3_CEPCN|nr:uncharacterized protein LOC107269328 [Cephus cinctus]XP_015598539.1 uncharacterized protein LOC107269328 [Cephus cinctus]
MAPVLMPLASSSMRSVELKQQCESPPVNLTTSTKRARDEEGADASAVHKKRKVMFPDGTCVMMPLQSSSSETSSEENTAAETKIKQLTENNKELARKVKSLKQVVRRRDWKIKNMTELFETLKQKNLIDDDLLIMLNNQFNGTPLAIFTNEEHFKATSFLLNQKLDVH